MSFSRYRRGGYSLLLGVMACLAVFLMGGSALAARNYDAEKAAYEFLTDTMELNPAAACGIMANIYGESNFIANINGGGGSYGICQWLGPRKSALYSYCASNGYDRSSLQGQLYFLWHELRTQYPSLLDGFKKVSNSSDGAYRVAYDFCYHFERPANKTYRSQQRGGYARNLFWAEYGSSAIWLRSVTETGDGLLLQFSCSDSEKHVVYRSTQKNGTYEKIGKVKGRGSGTYTDRKVVKGIVYYYQIRPKAETGKRSNIASGRRRMRMDDADCTITLSKTQYVYNGEPKEPKVTVQYLKKTLTQGVDYTVTYKKNTNAGKAKVIVEGRGDCSGSKTVRFQICKAEQKISEADIILPYTTKKVALEVGAAGKLKLSVENPKIAAVSGQKLKLKKTGQTNLTIKAAATRNYKATAPVTVLLKVTSQAPLIKSVKRKSTGAGKMNVKVRWSMKGKPEGFQIQYTSKAKLKKSSEIQECKKAGASSVLIRGLREDQTWRIRVRAYTVRDGKRLFGPWSEACVAEPLKQSE